MHFVLFHLLMEARLQLNNDSWDVQKLKLKTYQFLEACENVKHALEMTIISLRFGVNTYLDNLNLV